MNPEGDNSRDGGRLGREPAALPLDPAILGSVFDKKPRAAPPVPPPAPPAKAPPAATTPAGSPFHFSLFARDPLGRHLEAAGQRVAAPEPGPLRRPPPLPTPMLPRAAPTAADSPPPQPTPQSPATPASETPLPVPPAPPPAWLARGALEPAGRDVLRFEAAPAPADPPGPVPAQSAPPQSAPSPPVPSPPVLSSAVLSPSAAPEPDLELEDHDRAPSPPAPRRQVQWRAKAPASPQSEPEASRPAGRPVRWVKWLLAAMVVAGLAAGLAAALWRVADEPWPRMVANGTAEPVGGAVAYPLVTITAPLDGTVDSISASPGGIVGADDPILTLNLGDGANRVAAGVQQSQLADFDRQIATLQAKRQALMAKAPDQFYRLELAGIIGRLQDLQTQRNALAAQMPAANPYAPESNSAVRQPVTAGKPSRVVRLLVFQGDHVVAGTPLAVVGDCTALYATAPAARLTQAGLYGGDRVRVSLADGGGTVTGTIERDGPGNGGGANSRIDLLIGTTRGAWAGCPADAPVTIAAQNAN